MISRNKKGLNDAIEPQGIGSCTMKTGFLIIKEDSGPSFNKHS